MALLEPIPPTPETKGFPIGDVGFDSAVKKLGVVVELAGHLEKDDGGEAARKKIANFSMESRAQTESWFKPEGGSRQIDTLLERWSTTVMGVDGSVYVDDADLEYGLRISKIAFNTSLGIARAGFLPPINPGTDFSEEFVCMGAMPKRQVGFFKDNAWTTMHESHPDVYGVMAPWTQHFVGALSPLTDDKKLIVEASMVLPYMLSSTARGINYMDSWANIERAIPLADSTE